MNYETTMPLDQASLEAEERPGWSTGRKLAVALLVAAVLALVFWMLTGSSGEEPFTRSEEQQAPAVTVVAPGQATIDSAITAVGTLAARREMPVGVVGEGGQVVSVLVDAGDWVRAGQALAVIDRSVQTQQASSSAAQVEVAKADAQLAQANLDRALQLVERGFISQADIDRLTATRDAAVARVRVAEAQYRELLARNARLNIVAPAAGFVLERNVEPGQVVGAGAGALFRIARDGEFELLAQLGESELAQLRPGIEASVVPVGTDKTFTGRIWQLAPMINEQNRQGTARIALAYAPELRPGGFATATIKAGAIVAPMLPESAILSDNQGSYVYIVNAENRVERRAVQTGYVTDSGIAITSGLDGSERIVLRAGGFLTPDELVRPVTGGQGE